MFIFNDIKIKISCLWGPYKEPCAVIVGPQLTIIDTIEDREDNDGKSKALKDEVMVAYGKNYLRSHPWTEITKTNLQANLLILIRGLQLFPNKKWNLSKAL
jgi:hypothetical protein